MDQKEKSENERLKRELDKKEREKQEKIMKENTPVYGLTKDGRKQTQKILR